MPKGTAIFFICCLTVSAAPLVRSRPKQFVQDGIDVDVHNKNEEPPNIKRAIVDLKPAEVKHIIVDNLIVPMMSAMEFGSGNCEDVPSTHTGFDVHDANGFLKPASCDDLEAHCKDDLETNEADAAAEGGIGFQVRASCPVTCTQCTPGRDWGGIEPGKCFDAVNTGIRFRDGPKASCKDLINYCNQTDIGAQVTAACKLSCGHCMLLQEGPYVDTHENCVDLFADEEPEFTVWGKAANCSVIAQFCTNHPESNLIRHKCKATCGVCGSVPPVAAPHDAEDVQIPGDTGGCERRRRWGFCSSRRRDNFNDPDDR